MKEQTAFVADDGTPFFSESECKDYEAHCAARDQAHGYHQAMIKAGIPSRTATRRLSAVIAFLEWHSTGKIEAEEASQEGAPSEKTAAAA